MPTLLLTAFEPYAPWAENSSWLTLVELTKNLPTTPRLTTRRYPVDFGQLRQRLTNDLAANYDYVLHLGQAPGSACIQLETVGLNVAGINGRLPEEYEPLVPEGPSAYRSSLPLADWARKLRSAGIPCQVSYHAGTSLCNAALYLSQHVAEQRHLKTRCALVHLPLETTQTLRGQPDQPSLPGTTLAAAIRLILDEVASEADVGS